MSDIVEIERDLEQAREHLVHTLDEMNRKATATAQELLLPEEPIRRHPFQRCSERWLWVLPRAAAGYRP